MTLQEQIDRVLELAKKTVKRDGYSPPHYQIMAREKASIEPEVSYWYSLELYVEAPQMAEIISKQSEMLRVAKEALEAADCAIPPSITKQIVEQALATIQKMEKL